MAIGQQGLGQGHLGALGRAGTIVPVPTNNFFAANGSTYPFYPPGSIYIASTNTTWFGYEAYYSSIDLLVPEVCTYNHTTGKWKGPYTIGLGTKITRDQHGLPTLERDADGYVWCFYGAHNTSQPLARTRNVDDPTTWQDMTNLASPRAYPQTALVGSTMHLIQRFQVASSPFQGVSLYQKSTALSAGAITWGSTQQTIDFGVNGTVGSRVYHGNLVARGTDIHFCAAFAPGGDTYRANVYYFVLDTTTGNIRNFDSSVTVIPASQPISLATADTSFKLVDFGGGATDPATGDTGDVPQLAFDSNNHPHIVYPRGNNPFARSLYHIWHNGTSWQAPDLVGVLGDGVHQGGSQGISVGPGGTMDLYYVKFNTNTNYGGDVYTARWTNGVVGASSLILAAGATFQLNAPYQVRGGTTGAKMVFGEISSAATSPSGALKTYAYDKDVGFLARPIQSYLPQYQDYLDRLTVVPSAARRTLDNTMMQSLRNYGILAQADLLYFINETSEQSLLNWAQNAYNLTNVNSSPLVLNGYYTTDGTSSYFDSGFNMNTIASDKKKIATSSLSLMQYLDSSSNGNAVAPVGAWDVPNSTICFANWTTNTSMPFRLDNTASNGTYTITGGASQSGFVVISKNGTASCYANVNNFVPTAGSPGGTELLPNATFKLGALQATAGNYSTRRIKAAGLLGTLTAAQQAAFYTAVQTRMAGM